MLHKIIDNVSECVCVRACVHACVRACVRACVYLCVFVQTGVRVTRQLRQQGAEGEGLSSAQHGQK